MEEKKILLADEGAVDTLDRYLTGGGFQALQKALALSPEKIIDEIIRARLRGRGGAGFPTGIKWEGVRQKKSDDLGFPARKFLVCNASEGEPGTYKDRYLIQKNPYTLIEGILIASYAIGAVKAIICIKRVFEKEIAILNRALEVCRTAGILGQNRIEGGSDFPIEIVTGPDEYLLGEDRAMLEVIEGKPAWPRAKGIIPVDFGLFGQPTSVNNVETLATVPHIILKGARWFQSIGTADTPGTMIFTLTGDVQRPGLYELPMGTPLRTLIDEYGLGVRPDRDLKAVFSGPANAVIPPSALDTPLDFGSMRKIPSGLGSGGFTVYDNTACVVKAALTFSRFLAIESCGQCVSCKTGTGRITYWLERLEAGTIGIDELRATMEDCQQIKGQGRCFLVTEEGIHVGSLFYQFPDDVAAHVEYGCLNDRALTLPKIKAFDEATHTFVYDGGYFDRSFAERRRIAYPTLPERPPPSLIQIRREEKMR
jgi:NADH-quinone oxidoreductase subunit F